jgi:REP element-mobilizing transposase RayT
MQQGRKLNLKSDKAYYITMTVGGWIDIFTRKNHRYAIINSLKYCQEEKGLIIYAYVIMSNHIHMIVDSNGSFTLKEIIRDFKKFTSKKILQQIQCETESRRKWLLQLF